MRHIFNIAKSNNNFLSVMKFDNDPKCYAIDVNTGYAMGRIYQLNEDELRALADAIYADLGLEWLPYPEHRPEEFEGHYECYEVTIKDWRETKNKYFVWPAWFKNGQFENGQFGGPIDEHVIAYRPLSAPYQPEDA
jgi:hypothetical protein